MAESSESAQLNAKHPQVNPSFSARNCAFVVSHMAPMPHLRLNERKNSKIGQRQRDLAEKLYKAGLLSNHGLNAVRGHNESAPPRFAPVERRSRLA